MKKTTLRRLTLNGETIRQLTANLSLVHGGSFPTTTLQSIDGRGCGGSVAAKDCSISVDVCPTDNCGPSVHNSPEC